MGRSHHQGLSYLGVNSVDIPAGDYLVGLLGVIRCLPASTGEPGFSLV